MLSRMVRAPNHRISYDEDLDAEASSATRHENVYRNPLKAP